MSAFFGGLVKSIVRGGAIKALFRKGVKATAQKIPKGVKAQNIKNIRGIKSAAAQVAALPGAIIQGGQAALYIRALPGLSGNTLTMFNNSIRVNLARAAREALNADAVMRIVKILSRIGRSMGKSKAFNKLLQNARANETWSKYAIRLRGDLFGEPLRIVKAMLQGGAENIAIDQSAQALGNATKLVAASAVGGATTGVVINKSNT